MVSRCDPLKSSCTSCSVIFEKEGLSTCSKSNRDFSFELGDDIVKLGDWTSSKPFYRNRFESNITIERLPYQVDLLSDKLWPNFVTLVFNESKITTIYSGLTNSVRIFLSSLPITTTLSENENNTNNTSTTQLDSIATTSNLNRKTTIIVLIIVVTLLVIIAIIIIIFFLNRYSKKKNDLSSSSTSKSYNHPTPDPSINIDQMASTLRSTETNTTNLPSLDNQSDTNFQTLDFVTPQ